MPVQLHKFEGCSPAPLAHYLKAWGIMRLLSEQIDSDVRGFWEDESFVIASRLSRSELESFFLNKYKPTPFLSPWNGGSGFYPKDSKTGIDALANSTALRFEEYRKAIAVCRHIISSTGLKDKPDPKTEKQILLANIFKTWRGGLRVWLDAAIVFLDNKDVAYPSLLGSGGNDGRLDFTNNAMQRINELFNTETGLPREGTTELLKQSLWDETVNNMVDKPVGQFLPSGAGGPNGTTGMSSNSYVNPWDFLLMLEGCVAFKCQASRKLASQNEIMAVAPFTLRSLNAGFMTSGDDKDRGEQWMPLWHSPSSWTELTAMLGEARLQIDKRSAMRPVDAALSLSRHGTSRGINSFVRYSYLERNGQANIAVPLNRLTVKNSKNSRLIDDLVGWLNRLERISRDKHTPNSLTMAGKGLFNTVMFVLQHDATPEDWQLILREAVHIESLCRNTQNFAVEGKIPRLRPEWIRIADDASVEYRLALALAGSGAWKKKGWDSVRGHWLEFNKEHQRVVFTGRDPLYDFCSIVNKRCIESGMDRYKTRNYLPLAAHINGFPAKLCDIAEFLEGNVNMQKISELARALMAVDWFKNVNKKPITYENKSSEDKVNPDETWLAIRLAALPWKLDGGMDKTLDIRFEPTMIYRLLSGNSVDAVDIAIRRLRSVGITLPFRSAVSDNETARRWAAALAFPISEKTVRWAVKYLNPDKDNHKE